MAKAKDRWERMVEALPDDNGWVRSIDAAKLLRQQHRAVETKVRAYRKWCVENGEGYCIDAIDMVLAILKARAT